MLTQGADKCASVESKRVSATENSNSEQVFASDNSGSESNDTCICKIDQYVQEL